MWTKVADKSELEPGKGKVVNVDGKEIALFNVENVFCAMENTCPHRGGPLGDGHLEGPVVTCPWHAWTFDARTGVCQNAPDMNLVCFKSKVVGTDVLIEL